MDIRTWLTNLGLQRYADSFEENEVTVEDLPDLTPDDLGVKKLIDRKKLLAAMFAHYACADPASLSRLALKEQP